MADRSDLDLALALARAAGEHALAARTPRQRVETKPDGSPVSAVDRAIEQALRSELHCLRPDDGVLGEEFGGDLTRRRTWILDPLDGTAHYLEGRRDWGTHIALREAGEVTLGVVTRPDLGAIWYASAGGGAFRIEDPAASPRPLRTASHPGSARPRIALWDDPAGPLGQRLAEQFTIVDADLDAILDVIEGGLHGAIDVHGRPWDHAPYTILVEEAGGRFADRDGARRIDSGTVCYAGAWLLDAMLACVRDDR